MKGWLRMVNWGRTKELFGIDKPKYRYKVVVICDKCGVESTKLITKVSDFRDNQLRWICKKCDEPRHSALVKEAMSREDVKDKLSKKSKLLWQNTNYRKKIINRKYSAETLNKMSVSMKKKWNDENFANNVSSGLKKVSDKLSKAGKNMWLNKDFKSKMIKLFKKRSKELWHNPEYRKKVSLALKGNPKIKAATRILWSDPEYKHRMISLHKKLWQNDIYRSKMLELLKKRDYSKCSERSKELWKKEYYKMKMKAIMESENWRMKQAHARSLMPKVSSLQTILYSFLDDLNVKYYREYPDKPADKECVIGPYSFDCVIPRDGKQSLIIECQGEYWHSLNKSKSNDLSKATYIRNNLADKYELKYIWEHEFKCKDKVIENLRYWLGLSKFDIIDFELDQIEIKNCPSKEYRLLLGKYHYLVNAGIGGIAFGAYLNNELIAVCVFSPSLRQNKEESIGFKKDETRELSRLCIHPKYQKRNFASWFITRCIKLLPEQYKCIISYCDTTYNHDGTVYKACNFVLDKIVSPDYWYVDASGWVMHKKTLYNHAVVLKQTENQYAKDKGYNKVYGSEKHRYKFVR